MISHNDASVLACNVTKATQEDYWYAMLDVRQHEAQCRAVERELARVRWLSMNPSMVASDARTRVGHVVGGGL